MGRRANNRTKEQDNMNITLMVTRQLMEEKLALNLTHINQKRN